MDVTVGEETDPSVASSRRSRARRAGRRRTVWWSAALVAATSIASVPTGSADRADSAPAAWIDTSDPAAVRALYDQVWRRPEPAIGWTGSAATCAPGTVSPTAVAESIERVNAYRSLAGVPTGVVEDPMLSVPAQAAAMLMLANSALSHFPPSSWTCHSSLAADGAASSNLYLGVTGVDAIDGYMIDPGDNNKAVGHRWWILRPGTQRMGVGMTSGSQALSVLQTDWAVTTTRDPDEYITWPNAGYTPAPLVPFRWSVMNRSIDLSAATVTMSGQGGSVPLSIEYRSADRVVFVPDLPTSTTSQPGTATIATSIDVTVTTPATTFSYTVRLLDVGVGAYTPRTPVRVVDTRRDLGVAELSRFTATPIDIRTLAGLPPTATAVTANVTVVGPRTEGFLSLTDCTGSSSPWSVVTSSLNFAAGETRANLVSLPVGADGRICVLTAADTDLLLDVAGHHAATGDGFRPVTPDRIVDTRRTGTPIAGRGDPLEVQVTGRGGIPTGATSATMNITATGTTGTGYLTVWPCDADRPEVSNVNYVAGQSVPNLATVRLDPSGRVCIYADTTTDVLVDVAGYTLPS